LAIFPDILAFSFVEFTPNIFNIFQCFFKIYYYWQVGKILQRKIHCSKYHTYYRYLLLGLFWQNPMILLTRVFHTYFQWVSQTWYPNTHSNLISLWCISNM
jgi:hypothetical protein